MVLGIGSQDPTPEPSASPSPSDFPRAQVDENGEVVRDEGPNWPGSGAPPTGYPDETQVQWNTNDTPVRMQLGPGGGQYPAYEFLPFYRAALYPSQLRGRSRTTGSNEYSVFVSKLRAYTNQKLGTDSAVNSAWVGLLKDAQEGDVAALTLLDSVMLPDGSVPTGGTGGSRGVGAYTGPRESVTIQAESDITATANALAMEMIGRTLNQKELDRVTKRIRKAEQEEPQVTTGGVQRTETTQGLTAQGRQDILREVIAKRPEFEQYQLDTTVMDAMDAFIQEKRAVVDV